MNSTKTFAEVVKEMTSISGRRKVIAFTGKKRSGKDISASYCMHYHDFRKYAFADPVREVCKAFFGWPDFVFDDNNKEIEDKAFGITPRQAMQAIGTDIGRNYFQELFPSFKEKIGNNLWVTRFEMIYYSSYSNFVISDLRFPNEYESIRSLKNTDSYVIGINRDTGLDDQHESESYINELFKSSDYILDNNGHISDYFDKLERILKEIFFERN